MTDNAQPVQDDQHPGRFRAPGAFFKPTESLEHPQVEPPPAPSSRAKRLLVVGEDPAVFREVARHARAEGATVHRVPSRAAAIRAMAREEFGMVLVSLAGQRLEQLQWWKEMLRSRPRPPRLVAVVRDPALAVEAARRGPVELLPVPVERDRFAALLRRIDETESEAVVPLLTGASSSSNDPFPILSQSPRMLSVFQRIAQVAPTSANVLITGEPGTGKELVARLIHRIGPRAQAPFVALKCGDVPEHLLESELFGHEADPSPGAMLQRIGRFERASGGTLYLDGIGDASLAVQSKILRALQEGEIERAGGTTPVGVDVQLIAASSRDPAELVAQGRLRDDLYDCLSVVTIHLPRLADRGDDLFLLTSHFLGEFGLRYGKTFTGVSETALDLLRQHEWTGNVRELRGVIERAALAADGDVIRPEHLPEEWRRARSPASSRAIPSLRDVEARHIAHVLALTGGQIGEAARVLGLHRNTLTRKIRQYQL
jgi:DNA-binding NtrC family response regulator